MARYLSLRQILVIWKVLNEFVKDADLFLADTYLFDGHENHHAHFTAGEAGKIAKAAGAKRLILSHLPEEGDYDLLKDQAQKTSRRKYPSIGCQNR